MSTILNGFDEIIHPGKPLIATPHRITPVLDRYSTIEERADIDKKIDALVPDTSTPETAEEKEQRQVDETLRRVELDKLKSKRACHAELNLSPSTRYDVDSSTPTELAMRHEKA
jgi:hypothetical protein